MTQLILYLPLFYRDVMEMDELTRTEDQEINCIGWLLPWLIDESTITKASEERIGQWEKMLKIIPTGTLDQRKMMIIATLRGQGKLTEAKIKSICEAFTGDPNAEVAFHNSRIKIRIYPPGNGEVFLFPDVYRALEPLKPAHIGLEVERWYCTWGDVKQRQEDWQAVKDNFKDWNELKMWNLEV